MKSRRPDDTNFKQQRLPAWKPIMTAGTVLPIFIAIGVIFVPLGITFLMASDGVQQFVIDYTLDNCISNVRDAPCYTILEKHPGEVCLCNVYVNLSQDLLGQVFMYYGLENFYQNHRRYVRSRDDEQLMGVYKPTASSLVSECSPFRGYYDSIHTEGIPYVPCGAIANSLFNDTFTLSFVNNSKTIPVGLVSSGIAWEVDIRTKFKNPTACCNDSLPASWQQSSVYEGINYESEELMVWMRTAAMPKFKKFHRKINHSGIFSSGLPRGSYVINITYAFPVTSFGGRKQIILTTTSWLGGKNSFLGIGYIVVGSTSTFFGSLFLILHVRSGRHPMDLIQDLGDGPFL